MGQSINDHISTEQIKYSLQYSSIDDAVELLTALGKGALMAKVDLKSAFRVVPVHQTDSELLGMSWRDTFYFDTCLPFGLRSAPFLVCRSITVDIRAQLWSPLAHPLC